MANKKKYRFIISGGGSGGHIYPALSIADSIKNKFINNLTKHIVIIHR